MSVWLCREHAQQEPSSDPPGPELPCRGCGAKAIAAGSGTRLGEPERGQPATGEGIADMNVDPEWLRAQPKVSNFWTKTLVVNTAVGKTTAACIRPRSVR